MEIRDEATLPEMLSQLELTKIDRPVEMVTGVIRDHDFEFRETLMCRLQAKPHGKAAHGRIWARMPMLRQPVYQLVTGQREVGIHFEKGFGGNLARHSHRIYRLTEAGRRLGTIHYFPNNGFVLTNKEPCTSLSLIGFEQEHYVLYKADTPGPVMKSKPYGVLTTREGELVAIIIEAGGWFIPKRLLKLFRPADDLLVALLMATYHGLVFRTA